MTTPRAAMQELSPGGIVSLYTLDATNIGGSIYRFSDSSEVDGSSVAFGEIEYPYLAFASEGFAWSSDELPRPKLTIASINTTLFSLAVSTRGIQGAVLYRTRTFDRFLDGHASANSNMYFPSDIFIVDRVLSMNKEQIALELVTPMDLTDCKLPSQVALRDVCFWVYRHYDSTLVCFVYDQTENACPYAGTAYFTSTGESKASPSLDCCGRRLSDCVLRYGAGQALPYGGFPGLARQSS